MTIDYERFHPELQEGARKARGAPFKRSTLWLMRLALSLMPMPGPPSGVNVRNVKISVPGTSAKVRVRLYTPASHPSAAPALIWLHGGGLVVGKPEMDDVQLGEFARDLGIVVASVDYSLAPEYRFPRAVNEIYAALTWLQTQADALGVDPARIAVGGTSAGGCLAAAIAQMAHDRGVKLSLQLLVYPMLDDRTSLSADTDETHLLWTHENNRFGWGAYLGPRYGADGPPPYAAPARREDLSGLAPAWIGAGDADILHGESVAYARRLTDAGIACELVEIPGAYHGFDMFSPDTKLVRDFRASQTAALKRALCAP